MNKVIILIKNIVLMVFSFIFNFIPFFLSMFALLLFEVFDSNRFSRNYGFFLIALLLLILLVLQVLFIFKTNKVFQIIVAVTFAIDFILYLTLTIYIYEKPNTILNDFISSRFTDKDFPGFSNFFQFKHKCVNNTDLCNKKLHDSYNDNKVAFKCVSLLSTLLILIILGICILFVVLEFLNNKQAVSNDPGDLSDINEKSNKAENESDNENPENSSNNKKNNNVVVGSDNNSVSTKKNNSYIHLSSEISESEVHKKLEQEIFFGKPKYDPYEADPYEN